MLSFNKHSELAGRHATISASKYHWINYSDDKFITWVKSQMAAAEGTRIHNIAALLIKMGIKLPRNTKTLNRYVNDSIGFRMKPEQVLFHSIHAFGTADAISFEEVDGKYTLRIFDLKTGVSKADMRQLMVYVAFFCLEYNFRPFDIDVIDLRIYQNDDVELFEPPKDDITFIMDRIKTFDKMLSTVIEEHAA